MRDFLLEVAEAGDAGDSPVAREPPDGVRGHRAAPLELTGRCSTDASQGVQTRLDDQLRARTRAIRVAGTSPELAASDQRVGEPLVRGPGVALGGLGKRLERRADDRPALGIQEAVDPDQAVNGLADAQVTTVMGPIRLGERDLGADLAL